MDNNKMTGPEFKDARKSLGLTQPVLAENLDVTVRTIYNWENDGPTVMAVLSILFLMMCSNRASFATKGA